MKTISRLHPSLLSQISYQGKQKRERRLRYFHYLFYLKYYKVEEGLSYKINYSIFYLSLESNLPPLIFRFPLIKVISFHIYTQNTIQTYPNALYITLEEMLCCINLKTPSILTVIFEKKMDKASSKFAFVFLVSVMVIAACQLVNFFTVLIIVWG